MGTMLVERSAIVELVYRFSRKNIYFTLFIKELTKAVTTIVYLLVIETRVNNPIYIYYL